MRFQKKFQHGVVGVTTVLAAVLSMSVLPVSAHMTSDATPEASWDATAEAASDAPLTLLWQTSFTPETALSSPGDIAIDSDGNVYVSTQSMRGVKKFDSDGNFVLEWGGSGKGEGKFTLSLGIDTDADNNVYVTDFYNRLIQKFDSDGNFLTQWETEPSTSPAFLGVDGQGNVLIDQFPPHDEHYIQKFDWDGNLVSEWGNDNGQFGGRVEDIAVDDAGNLYAADVLMHRIQKFDPDGKLIATFGGEASKEGNGLFDDPFGVTVDQDGYVYVLDSHFLQKFDGEGAFVAQWSTAGGDLDKATNVAVDAEGNLYVFARADVTAANGKTVNVLVLKKFQQGAW